MKKYNETIKAFIVMFVTVLVFVGAMIGLNQFTGPLIEANKAGAALGALTEVLPEGKDFEDITSTLDFGGETVITKFYKEKNGNGFVFEGEKAGYSKVVSATVGVSADGKITGVKFNPNGDIDVSENTINSFVGKDSALSGVEITADVTISSNTLKDIVAAGMNILISNNLITAGVKGPEQILTELIPNVHSGLASGSTLKCDTLEGTGNVKIAYKGKNDSGFALIMTKGEDYFLAIVNNFGVCKVYDVEGADLTSENVDLQEEALTFTSNKVAACETTLTNKLNRIYKDSNLEYTTLSIDAFNTVVAGVEFEMDGNKYYAFYSKSFGYEMMNVYYVLDAEGKIVKMTADAYVFEEDYFFALQQAGGVPENYADGFVGLNSETFDGSQALISAATLSSNAMKTSTYDIFAAYEAIKGGE